MPSVTIREAATMLGVSPDTVRRRLARGELRGQQIHAGGRAGFTWYIDLPDDDAEPVALAPVPAVPSPADLIRQVEDLRAERDRLLSIIEALAARPAAVPQIEPTTTRQGGRIGRAWGALRGR